MTKPKVKPIIDVTQPIYTADEMAAINAAPVAPADTAPAPDAPAAPKAVEQATLEEALEAFIAAAALHVEVTGSTSSVTVGAYRVRFNGTQLISVTHA